jgi:hypothetical protein
LPLPRPRAPGTQSSLCSRCRRYALSTCTACMRMLACTLEQLVHSVFVVFALSKHTTDQVDCEHSRRTRTVVALFLQWFRIQVI